MGFRGFYIALCMGLTSMAGFGCGGGEGGPDAQPISLFDAAPPDALIPDAFVCVETASRKACGVGMAGCVDITRTNAHCGACDLGCPSPGQACVPGVGDNDTGNELAHCECPPVDFVPAELDIFDLGQFGVSHVNQNPQSATEWIGLAPFLDGALFHSLLVTYDLAEGVEHVGIDLDLSAIGDGDTAPRVVAGYNIDIATQAVQTPYLATAGTLHLDWACDKGFSGTVTDAVFVEVAGVQDPTPVNGGCGFTLAKTTFSVGTCPDDGGDTPPDDGGDTPPGGGDTPAP